MLTEQKSIGIDNIRLGLLAYREIVGDENLKEAIQTETSADFHNSVLSHVPNEYIPLCREIEDKLFYMEEDMVRISKALYSIANIDKRAFVENYRYMGNGRHNYDSSGSIESLVAAILGGKERKSVIDLCCGQGIFLTQASQQKLGKSLHGIENDDDICFITKVKMLILGENIKNIEHNDVFDNKWLEKNDSKYDAAFCQMPFNMFVESEKLVESGLMNESDAERFGRRDSEWAFIKAMQKVTKEDGCCIALVREGLLYTGIGQKFRKELVDSGKLEAIINLPEYMLYDSGVRTALLIMSKGNKTVKMIDASALYEKGRRVNKFSTEQIDVIYNMYLDSTDDNADDVLDSLHDEIQNSVTIVDNNQIEENDYYLDPHSYIINDKIVFKSPRKLGDSAEIFRGVQIRAADLEKMYIKNEECRYYELKLSDISDGYISDSLTCINVADDKRYKKYLVQEGDVVISCRGTKISIAVAEKIEKKNIIATGNLIVIRCNKNKLDPYYLKAFFESKTGKAILGSIQTGNYITAINPRQLKEILYDDISIKSQQEMGEKIKWLINELRETRERVLTLEEKITHLFNIGSEVE